MKKVAINIAIASIMLYTLGLFVTSSPKDTAKIIPLTTEQYFEGNFSYSPNAAFFEESISGAIIPVDITGLPFMIEAKYPQINNKIRKPFHIKLLGYLTPQLNSKGSYETHLKIKAIKEINETECPIQSMIGTYNGQGHILTISPDHTYTFKNKNGFSKEGNWFLHSKNMMVLLSEDSQTTMRINYKKKCLNSRDDNPTIFTLSSTLSSR